MSTVKTIRKKWVQFSEEDQAGLVVTSTESDVHPIAHMDVMRASRSIQAVSDTFVQLQNMMEDLSNWIDERWDKIDRAFISLGAGGMMFVVIRQAVAFDPNFEDELSDLDLGMFANEAYRSVSFRSLSLPNCSDDAVAAFIDMPSALMATKELVD